MHRAFAMLILPVAAALAGCSGSGPDETASKDSGGVETSISIDISPYMSAEAREVGCAIVTGFAKGAMEKAERPVALTDASKSGFDMPVEEAYLLFAYLVDGENGDPQSVGIRQRAGAFLALTKESAIEQCGELTALHRVRSHTPDPNEGVPPVNLKDMSYEYETFVLSIPLVDLDRGKAFMWYGHGCGPLCGGTGIEIYTRQPDGSWQWTDYQGLSIS
jgi:hypothetical protein